MVKSKAAHQTGEIMRQRSILRALNEGYGRNTAGYLFGDKRNAGAWAYGG
jgi:hypothetical protein